MTRTNPKYGQARVGGAITGVLPAAQSQRLAGLRERSGRIGGLVGRNPDLRRP